MGTPGIIHSSLLSAQAAMSLRAWVEGKGASRETILGLLMKLRRGSKRMGSWGVEKPCEQLTSRRKFHSVGGICVLPHLGLG